MDGRCAATRSVAQQASIDWRLLYLADHVGTMQSRDPFTSLFCLFGFFSSPTPRKKKEKEHSHFLEVQSPCFRSGAPRDRCIEFSPLKLAHHCWCLISWHGTEARSRVSWCWGSVSLPGLREGAGRCQLIAVGCPVTVV